MTSRDVTWLVGIVWPRDEVDGALFGILPVLRDTCPSRTSQHHPLGTEREGLQLEICQSNGPNSFTRHGIRLEGGAKGHVVLDRCGYDK